MRISPEALEAAGRPSPYVWVGGLYDVLDLRARLDGIRRPRACG